MRLPTDEELELIKEYEDKSCTEERRKEIVRRLDEIAEPHGNFN